MPFAMKLAPADAWLSIVHMARRYIRIFFVFFSSIVMKIICKLSGWVMSETLVLVYIYIAISSLARNCILSLNGNNLMCQVLVRHEFPGGSCD
jgi:hypothetical protein